MIEEKDNYDAPSLTGQYDLSAVSPGGEGQKTVPNGQLHGIPTRDDDALRLGSGETAAVVW